MRKRECDVQTANFAFLLFVIPVIAWVIALWLRPPDPGLIPTSW
jgi:hypothetical protein